MKKVEGGRSCEGCVFFDEQWADACDAGRRQVLSDRDEIVDDLVISRFCNMYRDANWLENKHDECEDNPNTEWYANCARDEVETKFIFVLNSTFLKPVSLHCLIRDIKNMDYDKDKFAILITGEIGTRVQELVHEVNVIKQHGIAAMLVLHTPDASEHSRDYDTYSKTTGFDYIITISKENTSALDVEMLESIDRSLNDDLEKVLYYIDKDKGIHVTSFFMMNSVYLDYNNYDLMIENLLEDMEDSGMYREL